MSMVKFSPIALNFVFDSVLIVNFLGHPVYCNEYHARGKIVLLPPHLAHLVNRILETRHQNHYLHFFPLLFVVRLIHPKKNVINFHFPFSVAAPPHLLINRAFADPYHNEYILFSFLIFGGANPPHLTHLVNRALESRYLIRAGSVWQGLAHTHALGHCLAMNVIDFFVTSTCSRIYYMSFLFDEFDCITNLSSYVNPNLNSHH